MGVIGRQIRRHSASKTAVSNGSPMVLPSTPLDEANPPPALLRLCFSVRMNETSSSATGLYVACDDHALVEVDIDSGAARNQWPLLGAPDATFFNPVTKLVHVAIGDPGLIDSIDPRTVRSD
jgi:hypothetical protein